MSTASEDQPNAISAADTVKALLAVDDKTKKKKSVPQKRGGKERTRDGLKKAEKELKQYQWADKGREKLKPIKPPTVRSGGAGASGVEITLSFSERSQRLGLALYWAH